MLFIRDYEATIGWIVLHCGGSDKFAHTYAGLLFWLIGALASRRSRAPFEIGLMVIITLEIANECVDRIAHGSWMWRDTLGDVAATCFWPAILTIAIRSQPRLFCRHRMEQNH